DAPQRLRGEIPSLLLGGLAALRDKHSHNACGRLSQCAATAPPADIIAKRSSAGPSVSLFPMRSAASGGPTALAPLRTPLTTPFTAPRASMPKYSGQMIDSAAECAPDAIPSSAP